MCIGKVVPPRRQNFSLFVGRLDNRATHQPRDARRNGIPVEPQHGQVRNGPMCDLSSTFPTDSFRSNAHSRLGLPSALRYVSLPLTCIVQEK